jgi:uroporphyrinogen-III synthase
MKAKVIALLETRTGAQLAELLSRRGALPLHAPALAEVPDVDLPGLENALARWRREPFDLAIFQTGVGTRALFEATETLGAGALLRERLAAAIVVVRGPKPTAELNARGVRIDHKARSPFTTREVLELLEPLALDGRHVIVQQYGESNEALRTALTERGARVEPIATYHWSLPADTQPLERLVEALAARQVDAVVFTSAVQVQNLAFIAGRLGHARDIAELLTATCVASIGPVCSRALESLGVKPTLEADPPKLGSLIPKLERYFDQR